MSIHHQQQDLELARFSSAARMYKSPEGYIRGFGKTVGNGFTDGWAPGAVFTHTDGATSGTLLYVNIGTVLTASWVAISDPRIHYERLGLDIVMLDDFAPQQYSYTTTSDGGAETITNGAYGFKSLATAAADNGYYYLTTIGPPADLNPGNTRFLYEARVRLAEANGTDANWWCGLILAADVNANIIGDDGAGPQTSYGGCLFWKVDGTMSINFETSKSTTQETQVMGDFASATWYILGMDYDGNTLTPYLNGVAGEPTTVLSPASGAYVAGFGVKAGDTNAETLLVDYHKTMMIVDARIG